MDAVTVGIVGGGLAGMAAAAAAVQRGFRVELFEQTRFLGGRAGSFRDSETGELVDLCPHVAMKCCTSLADFCRETAVEDCFQRDGRLHFFSPEGRQYDFTRSRWLPAPLHLLPGLMRLGYLTLRERWGIVRALGRLAREAAESDEDRETIGTWLRRQGQSERAIERFWSVVLVSALSESPDRASLAAARKVFLDGFLASRQAYQLMLPQRPLRKIWQRVKAWLMERGAAVHLGTPVHRVAGDAFRATGVVLRDGSHRGLDRVIVAVPWRQVGGLLPPQMLSSLPALAELENIQPAAIAAVHLWFDRPITTLPHAVLVGRLSQWVFAGASQHQYQVVISAAHVLAGHDPNDILAEVRRDLDAVFPAARDARLVAGRVVAQPSAVFSVRPGLDRLRPPQRTPVDNLFLAGDWTSTGWPATMESAIRSGHLAVEAIDDWRRES